MKFLKYILEILFPVSCVSCGASINDEKNLFFAKCLTETVFTSYPSVLKNEMVDRLVSIGGLKAAYAPLYFKKDAPVKNVFYKIKYGNRPDVAQKMAEFATEKFMKILPVDLKLDGVCYVPIHKIKLSKRGYNQSAIIAKVVADKLELPLVHVLERSSNIETQTHFGRIDRLKNQEGTIVASKNVIRHKHLLIIDDILTTGATIETCYDALRLSNPDCLISILTLAVTDSW